MPSDPFQLSRSLRLRVRRTALEDPLVLPKQDGHTEEYLSKMVPSRRWGYLLTFFALSFFVLAIRLVNLGIIQGEAFRQIAEGNRLRLEPVLAERGEIRDRNGTVLSTNVPSFALTAIPADLPKDEGERAHLAGELERLTGKPVTLPSREPDASAQGSPPVILVEDLPYEEAVRIRVSVLKLPGIQVRLTASRTYPKSEAFSHVVGYVGYPTREELERSSRGTAHEAQGMKPYARYGKAGLERFYDAVLRGKDGKREVEVDVRGKEQNVLGELPPTRGQDLVLSIDAALQEVLYRALSRAIEGRGRDGAGGVVMEVSTGEILAFASVPSYDPNRLVHGLSLEEAHALFADPRSPFLSRPIAGTYPSGSTIKPIIAAGALTEGVVTERTTILSTGGLQVGQWFFPDWKQGGHGPTTLVKALAESVNTYFYTIGGGTKNFPGLGEERLARYAHLFGLGAATGIDLNGERTGLIPTPEWKERTKGEQWYIGDTYHFAIGQGDVLVTPIQMVRMMAAIANGGTLLTPHFLKGADVHVASLKEQVPSSALSSVRKGLRAAVETGSARALAHLPIATAGKTGTAEVEDGKPHAWFVGFAPYEKPEIAVAVVVEHGGEGHEAALPVAREVFRYWAERK